jgi:hypothetical protein
MISLHEALYTKSPIDLERKRIIDESSLDLGRSIVKNYGKDAFSTAILESIMDRDPLLMNEFKSYGGFEVLNEDLAGRMSGGGFGGFFKKIGDAAKGAMASIELGTRSLGNALGFNKGDKQLQADYDKMLAKYEGAQQVNIEKIDKLIRDSIPKFPNNGVTATKEVKFDALGYKGETEGITPHGVFLVGLGQIAAAYDTIVASHEKTDGITTDQANIIIDDLRAMCVKFSNELAGTYTKFENFEKLKLMPLLYEAEGDVAASQDSLRSSSAEGAETAETAENKKKLMPKIMQGLGITVAALGVLQQMPFFQDWVKSTFSEDTYKTIQTGTEDVPGPTLPSGDGTLPAFSYQLQDALKSKGMNLSTNDMVNMTQAQTIKHCQDLGWVDASGKLTQGVIDLHKASGLPGDMVDAWSKTIGAVDPNTPMGGPGGFWSISKNPLFGNKPTPRATHQALGFVHGPISTIMKRAVMETVKVPGGGGLTALGSLILAPGLGQALLGAGIAIFVLGTAWGYLKDKGLKTSRSAALQELKDIMKNLKPKQSEINPTPPPNPNPAPPPVPVPTEAKGPDKVAVYLTGEKTMIGWDDPHDLLAPLTDGTIECDDKDNIKTDTNDAAVVMRARQILIKYFVCKPQRVKPSESSGLKTNDFSAFPKKLMELDVVVVRLGEDGKTETETVPGETPPEVPDEVVDEERKKKEDKKKGSSTAPGAGRLVRVDLSSKKGKGGDKGAAPAMAAEGAGMRMSDFLFEDAEVRKLGKDADSELKKKWQTLTGKAKVEKIAVPKDAAMFPTKEDPFFAKHKIDKKSGTGIALDTLGAATVSRGIRGIRNKVGSGNVVLGFDNSTAAEFESIGYGKYIRQILSIYSADPNKAPTFDDFISKMKEKKIPTVKNQDKLKDILTRIGMISTAKASKGGAGTPETKKESFDRTEDDVILERWQSLAGLLQD